jgi:hypothetical protein
MRPQHILCASLLAAGFAVPLASAASANVVITVDKSTQRMLVAVDGATRYDWPVSTGRRGFNTPSGAFKPNRMEVEHFSKEYENAPMPHSIFFDLHGHAIHGFFDTPHLGMAVSHGCVRLSPANATTLFSLVKDEGMANTEVIIHGHIPSSQAPLVARRQVPDEEASAEQPTSLAPGYGQPYQSQQPYATQQPYGQPAYRQQAYGQPSNGQYSQPAFPPQPAPVYARPAYGQPYGGGQAYYRQQPYGQSYDDQPTYQQYRPYSPY